MTDDFSLAVIYRTKAGDDRCLVIGGRADMLAGRPGATAAAIAEADPDFASAVRFFTLCLDAGISLRGMDPESALGGHGRIIPRAYVEYPWAMKPRPLDGDLEWDGWPWTLTTERG